MKSGQCFQKKATLGSNLITITGEVKIQSINRTTQSSLIKLLQMLNAHLPDLTQMTDRKIQDLEFHIF